MKNPFKHLKHMWKDPINTIDEANARKKEVLPWLIGAIVVTVLGVGLSQIKGLDFLVIFAMVGVFAIMFFGFMLFIIMKAKQKFKALTCDKCHVMAEIKTPEDFAKYVSYTVGKHEATYLGVSHPGTDNGVIPKIEAKGSATVVVAIDLKCPHCGKRNWCRRRLAPKDEEQKNA